MFRLRYLAMFGLLSAFVAATAFAQEKKDPPKEAKKDDTKKEEPKKDDTKKEEPKKEEPKKDPPKAEPAGMNWKFTKDVSFYQKMDTNTEQNIKVMGLDVTQKQEQTFYFKWTPLKQDGDKWEIRQEIEGLKMKIDIAGNPVSFDSTQENPAGGANSALAEFFKALKGSSFTLTLNTKTMKVEKVEGREAFLTKLSTANPQLEPLLKKILSEDALRQMADPTFGITPPAGKKAGDTWENTSALNLGPIGTYNNKYKYTWKGPFDKNKDLEQISVETTLTYTAPTEADPALPFKIKASTLTTKEKQDPGTILFNTKVGRLESSDMKLAISGSLTIEIGGNTTQVELFQNQSTKIDVSDKSLLPAPADPKKQ